MLSIPFINVYFPDIRDSCGDDRVSKPNSSSRPYRVSAFFSDEADESLALFRTQMLGQFPFTKIPGEHLASWQILQICMGP